MSDSIPRPVRSEESSNVPSKPASGRQHRWVWVAAVIILAVGGILFFRHRSQSLSAASKAGSPPPSLMVSTATAQKGDIGIYVNALGVVTAFNTDRKSVV